MGTIVPKTDLLGTESERLQEQYGEVLRKGFAGAAKGDWEAVIDEIKTFWYTNRRLVDCILGHMCRPTEAYAFTAATYMNVADKDHYPFVALGACHFLDDPICRLSQMMGEGAKDQFRDQARELVVKAIGYNIEIIEKYSSAILILPIRYLAQTDTELIQRLGTQAFLSMFSRDMDMEQYYSKVKTTGDIEKELKPGMEKNFIFSEDDDTSLSLQKRLDEYRAGIVLPFERDVSDGTVFWFALYGYLTQALEIMMTCLQYRVVPYIRYSVAARYLLMLSRNLADDADVRFMVFRAAVAHILHRSFDKTKIETIEFEDYCRALVESSFSANVFTELESAGVTLDSLDVSKTVRIIKQNLDIALQRITAK